MSTYPTMDNLVNAMNGSSSTNNWDMVCSYTTKQLNDFLATAYAKKKLVTEMHFDVQEDDPLTGEPFTVKYDLFLGKPTLKFIAGRSDQANLTMLITGGTYSIYLKDQETPFRTADFPKNTYSVDAYVPLAAVTGDTGKVSSKGDIVTFDDDKTSQSHVILHFANEKGTQFKIMPEPDPSLKAIINPQFVDAVESYFTYHVTEIDYALAQVNNDKASQGSVLLTPKSFVFASEGDGETGILSLYIQVKESGNPPGNRNPSFQPGTKEMLPIPENFTASLILGYQLLTTCYITKQLQDEGFAVTYESVPKGIACSVSKDLEILAKNDSGHWLFGSHYYKGFDINFKDHPIRMQIADGSVSLNWQASADTSWSENASFGRTSSNQWGGVKVTLSYEQNGGAISLNTTTDEISIAAISITPKDIHVGLHNDGCSFWERLVGCMESHPSFYDNLSDHLEMPKSLSLDLKGLNFLMETNLLAPGEKMIDFSSTAGVKTPMDFLLVGQVTSK